MRKVGIIGGLGPETTSVFYIKTIFEAKKRGVTVYPSITIASVELPFDIEQDSIGNNKGIERCLPFLLQESRKLENAGVDFIVMPCNSLHCFINEIRSCVKIPVLSIAEETVKYIKLKKYDKVGLISTLATVQNKVYESKFLENNINFILPNGLQQAEIGTIIQNLVNAIHLNDDREKILAVVADMKCQGASAKPLRCWDSKGTTSLWRVVLGGQCPPNSHLLSFNRNITAHSQTLLHHS